MTVKEYTTNDYKELYQDLINNKIHADDCFCPSCLYQFWKMLPRNKHTKIRKQNFFIGWILFQTGKVDKTNKKTIITNWKKAENILSQIDQSGFLNYPYSSPEQEKYRIAYRYIRIVDEACERKIEVFNKLRSPKIQGEIHSRANLQALRTLWQENLQTDKKFDDLKNRALLYIMENKEVSHRQLLRHSNKKSKDLAPILSQLWSSGKIILEPKTKKLPSELGKIRIIKIVNDISDIAF